MKLLQSRKRIDPVSDHRVKPRRKLRVIDLFCGAGGLALGFQAAGCRIIGGVDLDEAAAETFEANFRVLQGHRAPLVFRGPNEADLSQAEVRNSLAERFSHPDIVLGGPPCQAFSKIGRGKLNSLSERGFSGDPRNTLYRSFLDLVGRWRPRAFVMENVPGMLSVSGKNIAEVVAAELAGLGYRVGYTLLNAVWYGVPQFRERIFFIGIRKNLHLHPMAPVMTHQVGLPPNYSPPRPYEQPPLFHDHFPLKVPVAADRCATPTVREALDDLPPRREHLGESTPVAGSSMGTDTPDRIQLSNYMQLMRTWPGLPCFGDLTRHDFRHNPRDYRTFERMSPGDRYPEALQIAEERFQEELQRQATRGDVLGRGELEAIRASIVPPYPRDSFADKWCMLVPDEPSWTVPAHLSKDGYSHIHYDRTQARTITVREAARLQSFPDAFVFAGNLGNCFGQIGNAVPPLLAWAVADSLLAVLGVESNPPPSRLGSPYAAQRPPGSLRTQHRVPAAVDEGG